MKRPLFLVILALAFPLLSYTQEHWAWQNPLPQGNLLVSVSAPDSQTAVAVGAAGTIVRTTDGGDNWSVSHPSGSDSLWLGPVRFIDPLHGRILKGTPAGMSFLVTRDGGITWEEQDLDDWDGLNDFMFLDTSLGFAVGMGGNVLRTTDGGLSWGSLTSPTFNRLVSVCFTDTSHGWAASWSELFQTSDGGATWDSWSPQLSSTLKEVRFLDSSTGWVVGYTGGGMFLVFRSTDGGYTWIDRSPSMFVLQILSGYFHDRNTGVIVGLDGVILKTTDGGLSWDSLPGGTSHVLQSVDFFDADNGWIVGGLPDCNPCGGFLDGPATILRTTDGGNSWSSKITQPGRPVDVVSGVQFLGKDTGWVATSSGILKTTNGGELWLSVLHSDSGGYTALHFIDPNTGWAVGGPRIAKTTDGGASWIPQSTDSSWGLRTVFFVNEATGWVAGEFNRIFKTTDGGDTWISQHPLVLPPWDIRSIRFTDTLRGWAAGGGGWLFRTTDAGTSWEIQLHPLDSAFSSLKSIFFLDATHGWIAGPGVLKTTNGGDTWFKSSDTEGDDIFFTDTLDGWMTQDEGYVVHTSDGGTTWDRVHTGTTRDLGSVFFTDRYTGYFTGRYGTILKTTTGGGVTGVEHETYDGLPAVFSLLPNFPNPFNGSTVLLFELPRATEVLLRIFDLLGREVKTIVDERMTAGVHRVVWDAGGYPSGVYYCTVRAGGQSRTGKMLLVR